MGRKKKPNKNPDVVASLPAQKMEDFWYSVGMSEKQNFLQVRLEEIYPHLEKSPEFSNSTKKKSKRWIREQLNKLSEIGSQLCSSLSVSDDSVRTNLKQTHKAYTQQSMVHGLKSFAGLHRHPQNLQDASLLRTQNCTFREPVARCKDRCLRCTRQLARIEVKMVQEEHRLALAGLLTDSKWEKFRWSLQRTELHADAEDLSVQLREVDECNEQVEREIEATSQRLVMFHNINSGLEMCISGLASHHQSGQAHVIEETASFHYQWMMAIAVCEVVNGTLLMKELSWTQNEREGLLSQAKELAALIRNTRNEREASNKLKYLQKLNDRITSLGESMQLVKGKLDHSSCKLENAKTGMNYVMMKVFPPQPSGSAELDWQPCQQWDGAKEQAFHEIKVNMSVSHPVPTCLEFVQQRLKELTSIQEELMLFKKQLSEVSLQLGDAIIKVQPRMLVIMGTALQWLQNRFAEAFLLYDGRARAEQEQQLAMRDAEARRVSEQLVAQEMAEKQRNERKQSSRSDERKQARARELALELSKDENAASEVELSKSEQFASPSESKSESESESDEGCNMWACQFCTFINTEGDENCVICEASRDGSVSPATVQISEELPAESAADEVVHELQTSPAVTSVEQHAECPSGYKKSFEDVSRRKDSRRQPVKTLWVGGLRDDWVEEDLASLFPNAVMTKLVYEPDAGSYGFIEFDTREQAQSILEKNKNKPIAGMEWQRHQLNWGTKNLDERFGGRKVPWLIDGVELGRTEGESDDADAAPSICQFYLHGKCVYGSKCHNLHAQDSQAAAECVSEVVSSASVAAAPQISFRGSVSGSKAAVAVRPLESNNSTGRAAVELGNGLELQTSAVTAPALVIGSATPAADPLQRAAGPQTELKHSQLPIGTSAPVVHRPTEPGHSNIPRPSAASTQSVVQRDWTTVEAPKSRQPISKPVLSSANAAVGSNQHTAAQSNRSFHQESSRSHFGQIDDAREQSSAAHFNYHLPLQQPNISRGSQFFDFGAGPSTSSRPAVFPTGPPTAFAGDSSLFGLGGEFQAADRHHQLGPQHPSLFGGSLSLGLESVAVSDSESPRNRGPSGSINGWPDSSLQQHAARSNHGWPPQLQAPTSNHGWLDTQQQAPTSNHGWPDTQQQAPTSNHRWPDTKQQQVPTSDYSWSNTQQQQQAPTSNHGWSNTQQQQQQAPTRNHGWSDTQQQQAPTSNHGWSDTQQQQAPTSNHGWSEAVGQPTITPPPGLEVLIESTATQPDPAATRQLVVELLVSLGLNHLTAQFNEEQIDCDALRMMTDQDLKELQIGKGPRMKLCRWISTQRQHPTSQVSV